LAITPKTAFFAALQKKLDLQASFNQHHPMSYPNSQIKSPERRPKSVARQRVLSVNLINVVVLVVISIIVLIHTTNGGAL